MAVVSSHYWGSQLHHNGVVTYARNLVDGMRQLGARVYVLANEVDPGWQDAFVRAVPDWRDIRGNGLARILGGIGRRVRPDYTDIWMMARRLAHEITALHEREGIELFETEESCGVAGLLAPMIRIPIVLRLHGPWFVVGPAAGADANGEYRRRLRYEGCALTAVAGVSAPCRDVIRRTEAFYGISLEHAEVIPNPVQPVPESKRWSLTRCDRNRLLFVGRFDVGKGADILLDMFVQVLREVPQAKLTLVGPDIGIVDARGHRTHAQAYIDRVLPEPAMARRVEWLGPRTPEEILQLRQASFMSVVASRYENFSMVTLEAMAAGCPLVAPDVGGTPEMVRHAHNGLLFKPGRANDLAEKILMLMRDPDMACSLGAQAAADALEKYHPVAVARRTLELYREVLDRTGQASKK